LVKDHFSYDKTKHNWHSETCLNWPPWNQLLWLEKKGVLFIVWISNVSSIGTLFYSILVYSVSNVSFIGTLFYSILVYSVSNVSAIGTLFYSILVYSVSNVSSIGTLFYSILVYSVFRLDMFHCTENRIAIHHKHLT
jgi:hypothetical protein